MAGNAGQTGRSVTSKVTAILLTFTDGPTFSLTEIAHRTGLPLSTTHRLLGDMTASRLLVRTQRGDYQLGLPILTMMTAPNHTCDITMLGPQVLEDLAAATNLTVRLGILHQHRVAYIEKTLGRPLTNFIPAATLPLHASAAGKALLAFAPVPTVNAVLTAGLPRFTDRTITRPERLRQALTQIRLNNVALSDGELRQGTSAIAVPVSEPGGRVVGALEATIVARRADLGALASILALAARSITRELTLQGFRGRASPMHQTDIGYWDLALDQHPPKRSSVGCYGNRLQVGARLNPAITSERRR